jgi:iron complex outermembrane receptor protein
MKFKLYLFFAITFLISTHYSQSNEIEISGAVIDSISQELLLGVNVLVDDTLGAVTDLYGRFNVSIPSGSKQMKVSYVGYETKIILLDSKIIKSFNISLVETDNELDVVVVSASRFKQKLEEVTVSVDVINARIIESKNCITLTDVLKNAPGVQITDGQLNIRAGSGWRYGAGSRVLVMIDDMPLLSADQGEVLFNMVPLENVEQIEIIKGASSALYGSSALNGIVNVRSKMPGLKPETHVSYFQGFWDAPKNPSIKWWGDSTRWKKGLNFTHLRKIGKLDLVVSGSHFNDMGFIKDGINEQTRFIINTRYNFKNIILGLSANYMDRSNGKFVMWSSDSTAYTPLEGTMLINYGRRFYIDPSIVYLGENSKHTLRSRILSRNIYYNDILIESLLTYSEYQHQYKKKNTSFTSGLVATTFMGETGSYGGRLEGINYSVYSQFDQKVGDFNISTGARYEIFDLDTIRIAKPVFRGGLNYEVFEGLNLRTSYGQGFRFPSIAEMFMQGEIGPINLYNNPNLQAESGWTSELGLKKAFTFSKWKGYVDLVGFVMEYNNMMEFTFGSWGPSTDPMFGLGFSSVNVGKTRISGLEFTFNGEGSINEHWGIGVLSGFNISNPISVYPDSIFAYNNSNTFGYTFNNTSSDTSGNHYLKYRSRKSARLDIEFSYKKKISIGFSYQYNSKMNNVDSVFTTPLFNSNTAFGGSAVDLGINNSMEKLNRAYHLMDFRIRIKFFKRTTLALMAENIFNTEYLLRPASFGSPRTFMAQVKVDF